MNFDDPDFLRKLQEALLNIQGGNTQPRRGEPRPVEEFKITELPEFAGGADPEVYLEWERKIERLFDFKNLSDEKRCGYAVLRLCKSASLWLEGVKSKRVQQGKEKITSWDSLKRKLRRRYVPATHRITTYRKIADLKQGKLTVGEYIDEFESLALMGEINEAEEQKMARFIRGLNYNIANSVELYPYADFDTLCGLCLKIESQGKMKFGGGSSYEKPKPVIKQEFSSKTDAGKIGGSSSSPYPSAPTFAPRTTSAPRENQLAKNRCFKCQGFGHFQNACPNKRVVTLREAIECREDVLEEERLLEMVAVYDEEPEEEENYEAPDEPINLVLRSLQVKNSPIDLDQRDQLFHTKCRVKDKWCSVIIDGGSCTNVASSEMVEKLGLTTLAHPKPYALHWLDNGSKVKVSKQVRVCLTFGSYVDEIVCDVIPMDACHILLGRPWQFDRDVVHRGRSNEYELRDGDKKIVLKPMSSQAVRDMSIKKKKTENLSMLMNERDVERALDGGEQVYLLVSKECSSVSPRYGERDALPFFRVAMGLTENL